MEPTINIYIQGIPNRGKEIINLLEKVYGGINTDPKIDGNDSWLNYFINSNGNIKSQYIWIPISDKAHIVSLDEIPYIYIQGNKKRSEEICNYFKSIGINPIDCLCNDPEKLYFMNYDKTVTDCYIGSYLALSIKLCHIEIKF